MHEGTFLTVQWLRLRILNAAGPGSILVREVDPHAITKTWCSQINILRMLSDKNKTLKKKQKHS